MRLRFCARSVVWTMTTAMIVSGCATGRHQPMATAPPPTPAPTAAATPAQPVDLTVATRLEQQGRLREARAAYETALKTAPNDARCLHRLAVVCTATDDHAAAADYYNRALALEPQNVDLLTDAGYACYLRNEHEAAEALLREAVNVAPTNERAGNNLGLVLGATGRMEAALEAFWQANPPVDAWRNMAYVYQERSEWDAAIACYDEARKLDPTVIVPAALLAHRSETEPATQPVAADDSILAESPVTTAAAPVEVEIPSSSSTPFEAPVVAEPVTPLEPEPIFERDFGPFEPPVVIESDRSASAVPAASRLPPGALPIISPGWPGVAPEESIAESVRPVVIAERPLKRGSPEVFDIVYDTAEDVAPEPITEETIELVGSEWIESLEAESPGFASVVADLVTDPATETPLAALALSECCLVALHDDRRLVAARPEFAVAYRDQRFCFSSAAAVERFVNDPDSYLPAAAGLDVVAVRQGWVVVAGSLDYAVWFRGKLFLFASKDNLVAFQAHPYRYVDYE